MAKRKEEPSKGTDITNVSEKLVIHTYTHICRMKEKV